MARNFTNMTYAPTRSVIDYTELYNYSLSSSMRNGLSDKVTTPNFAALSAWKQSLGEGRADFVKAF